MQLNGEAFTIVGVASVVPGRVDVCLPMAFTPEQTSEENRGAHWVNVAARLKPGVSVARADAELKLIAGQVAQSDLSRQGWSAVVVSLLDFSVQRRAAGAPDAAGCGGLRVADRVCQRFQSVARPGRHASPGNLDSHGARRQSRPADLPTPDRELPSRVLRRWPGG